MMVSIYNYIVFLLLLPVIVTVGYQPGFARAAIVAGPQAQSALR